MNKTLAAFARERLKLGLVQCTDAQQHLFKRMYCPRSLERPIDEVVDAMTDDKLDWAMQQVERTLEKRTATHNG